MAPRPSLDRNNSVRILYGFVVSRSFEDQANQENSNGVPGHPLLQSCRYHFFQNQTQIIFPSFFWSIMFIIVRGLIIFVFAL